ncbi:MAG: hypothetical protein ACYDAY_11860 [Candidatus Dormibacteria bacterium]
MTPRRVHADALGEDDLYQDEAAAPAADAGPGEGADGTDATRALVELLVRLAGMVGEVIPPEAQVHFMLAQAEMLKGVRAMVEHHLSSAAQVPPEARARHQKRSRRVEIMVD